MVEVILSKWKDLKGKNGEVEYDYTEYVDYDMVKEVAMIENEGDIISDFDTTFESEIRFKEDIKIIRKMAEAEINELKAKLWNNQKIMNCDNEKEVAKATKHFNNNKERMLFLESWLEKNKLVEN